VHSSQTATKPIKKEIVMIRKSMMIMFALLVLITAGTVVGAEMAKEGNGDYRSGKTGTPVVLAMGKERLQMNFEEIGVVVSAPENSPLHNASFRNIGTLHAIKGKWKGIGFVDGPSKSVLKFVGGTGTCTGIEGTMELGNTPGIKPAKEGVWNGISVGKFNWKIP
jgi:hypothetical protein